MNNPFPKFLQRMHSCLFSEVDEPLSEISNIHREIALIFDLLRPDDFLIDRIGSCGPGRPKLDRGALVRAFVAKAYLNISTTSLLLERLQFDGVLRRLCGWFARREVPCESTFSNAFSEFSTSQKFNDAHDALVSRHFKDTLIFHISRDSTAIEAREKKVVVAEPVEQKKFPRGRPRLGEERPTKELKRLEKQPTQSLAEMLNDLPVHCDSGAKTNSKGHAMYWNGYKLHLDICDGGIPISAILTSASVHDSQVAIPLEEMTSQKVTSLYSLMDAAYDCDAIKTFIGSKGKKAIADSKKKRGEEEPVPLEPCDKQRFKARTTVERTYSDLKDNHGGRNVRVKGGAKVFAHLMAGVVAITAKMILRL